MHPTQAPPRFCHQPHFAHCFQDMEVPAVVSSALNASRSEKVWGGKLGYPPHRAEARAEMA